MKKLFVISLACVLSLVILSGCATQKKEEPPPSPLVVQAVIKSLNHAFGTGWSGIKIYVERSNLLPANLGPVGSTVAEVISREDLITHYEYEKVSPALATVDAHQESDGQINVTIIYRPIKMKYHTIPYKGGQYEYTFKVKKRKLIMTRSTVAMD